MKKNRNEFEEIEEKVIYLIKIILGFVLIAAGIIGIFIPIFPDIILILTGLILMGNKPAKKLAVKLIRKIRVWFK
jgi:uncharacterized membrane protein YbaN (DUF454 family)